MTDIENETPEDRDIRRGCELEDIAIRTLSPEASIQFISTLDSYIDWHGSSPWQREYRDKFLAMYERQFAIAAHFGVSWPPQS